MNTTKHLAVVVCAALSAKTVQELIPLVQSAGWDVWLISTPNATKFIDEPLLQQLTGHPITVYPTNTLPTFDAVIVAPATFNTLKKWASGITDTFALTFLCNIFHDSIPVLVIPRASQELAQEPEFYPSLTLLRAHAITVLYQPDRYPPNNNITWSQVANLFTQIVNIS